MRVFLLLLLLARLQAATISGVVMVQPGKRASDAVVHLFASDGQLLTGLCDNDGSFVIKDVPKGTHLLQAHFLGLYFPEVCA